MTIITTSLSHKIELLNNYLVDKVEQEPNYYDFIQELKATVIAYQKSKIKIKFVSQFVNLVEQLQLISQQQFTEQLLCHFHIVADVKKIDNILEDCDLLCLVRDSHSSISRLDKQLIQKADKANICQAILNIQRIENSNYEIEEKHSTSIHTWLTKQKYAHIELFCLPLYPQKKDNLSEQIDDYYLFKKLLSSYESQLETRISQTITLKLNLFFASQRKSVWYEIKQKKLDLNNQQQICYQQKSYLLLPKSKQQRQGKIKKIKDKIHQEKITIINSFSYDSLVYKVSQLVEQSEANLFKENQKRYIQLIVKQQDISQRLSTVVINLCQEELDNWVEEKWQEIERIDELNFWKTHGNLFDFDDELESIQKLSLVPNFELSNFVSLPLLEESSETIFDYCFLDSSEFRLAVTLALGLVLYFFTGRLFGFAFLVFQMINFLTGKDVKTQKLKQQTKELKRKSASQYQSLVRFLVDRASYTLVLALENKNQNYQEIVDRLTEESETQLTQLKQTISEHKDKLHDLKQDEMEILSLLQQNSVATPSITASLR